MPRGKADTDDDDVGEGIAAAGRRVRRKTVGL
jgi:hypothetical protein